MAITQAAPDVRVKTQINVRSISSAWSRIRRGW
jgi:hypothetical protein